MKPLLVSALLLALLLIAALWWLGGSEDRVSRPPQDDAAAIGPEPAQAPADATPGPDAATSSIGQSFRERLRSFVAEAAGLPRPEREAAAETLRRETLAREADGSLLAAESAYIQLALLHATVTDEALLRRQSQALLARYRTASEQGWEAYRSREKPRHDAYRAAEAELIRRARQDGLSDDELRTRLQALRAQYYQ